MFHCERFGTTELEKKNQQKIENCKNKRTILKFCIFSIMIVRKSEK